MFHTGKLERKLERIGKRSVNEVCQFNTFETYGLRGRTFGLKTTCSCKKIINFALILALYIFTFACTFMRPYNNYGDVLCYIHCI